MAAGGAGPAHVRYDSINLVVIPAYRGLRLAVGSLPCGRVPADQERRPVVLLEGIIIVIIILFVEGFVGRAPEPVPGLR